MRGTVLIGALLAAGCHLIAPHGAGEVDGGGGVADSAADRGRDSVTPSDLEARDLDGRPGEEGPDPSDGYPGEAPIDLSLDGVFCTPPLESCNGVCVDKSSHWQNCGGCDVVCCSGSKCASGACVPLQRLPNGTLCGSCVEPVCDCQYVDTDTDPNHCGNCNAACDSTHLCIVGSCVCPAGQQDCSGACVDLKTDDDNCGSCGVACDPKLEKCVAGSCDCQKDVCGGVCVDTQSNPLYCGGCASALCVGDCVQGVCSDRIKRVFVTSGTYSGALGGVVGADLECAKAALDGFLGGVWKAWISTSDHCPACMGSVFNTNVGRYVLVDGLTVVAEGWSALTSGALDHAINMDEHKGIQSGRVWSNTTFDGQRVGPADCAAWLAGNSSFAGAVGNCGYSSSGWAETGSPFLCTGPARLYCFEQ